MAFIVREQHSGRLILQGIALVLLWIISVWLAYQYGWEEADRLFGHELEKNRSLHERLTDVTRENRDLQAQIAILERTAQVDREAKIELVRETGELQARAAELREEVSFYKSIISPENGRDGLNVHSLEVMPTSPNLYHFKVILTRAGNSDHLAEGKMDIMIEGILKGREKHLGLSDIQPPEDKELTYKFQYFQELTGNLKLPKGFIPREIIVKLIHNKGNKDKDPVKRFDWSDVRA